MTVKKNPPLELSTMQADIALDILKKMREARIRMDLYHQMAIRNDPEVSKFVRYVDQESHKDVLDVPVEDLKRKYEIEFETQASELVKYCGIRVTRK